MLKIEKVREVAQGCFVKGDLLVRKWVPCDGEFIGEPVFQLVGPSGFHELVGIWG